MIAFIGSRVLKVSVFGDIHSMFAPLILLPGFLPIFPDARCDVSKHVARLHMDMRHNLLQGDGLALEAAFDLGPVFIVVVINASIADIGDFAAIGHQPLGQFHILKTR